MSQQSLPTPQNFNHAIIEPQHSEMTMLQKEISQLFTKLNVLKECQMKEKQLNEQIDKLQKQSQQHYSSLRKITLQYTQQYTIFSSKIDNRSEDICDERDRIESNIYYLEQENQRLDQQCKNKLKQRKRLSQDVQIYDKKKEKLTLMLLQENSQLAQKMKRNKIIEEITQSIRKENQIYQEEIYEIDLRGQNLRKYGYEIVPERLQHLLQAKERIQNDLQDLNHKKERHKKSINKLIKLQVFQKAQQVLAQQKQKQIFINLLNQQNMDLKQDNDRLILLKNSYEWNPNLQIKQFELSLKQQQKKIATIQKDLSSLKRKSIQISQKIKEYNNYFRIQSQNESFNQQEGDNRKTNKEKSHRKQKSKSRHNTAIFQQIKNDLQLRNPSKQFNWKEFIKFGSNNKEQSKIKNINETTYLLKKPSQIKSIIIVFLLLVGLSYVCCIKSYKK